MSQVQTKPKATLNVLASAVKIDISSGIRCILIWLPDITANQPLSLPLTHQYNIVDNSYNDFAAVRNNLLICVDLIQIFPECKSKSISGCFTHQAGIFGVNVYSTFCGLILVDSKSGEILMPNDLIALGFSPY